MPSAILMPQFLMNNCGDIIVLEKARSKDSLLLFEAIAEQLELVDDLVGVVGEGELQVFVHAGVHEVLEQGIDGNSIGPKRLAEEDHGA